MRVVLPFLLLGVSRAAVQCGNVVCFHNSKCIPGDPDTSLNPIDANGNPVLYNAPNGGVHCECSQFFTGTDCSIPVENCDDGEHYCQ